MRQRLGRSLPSERSLFAVGGRADMVPSSGEKTAASVDALPSDEEEPDS